MNIANHAQLLTSIGLVAAVTIGFALFVRLLMWMTRRAEALVETHAPRALKLRGYAILSGQQLRKGGVALVRILALGAGLLSAYVWLTFVLTRFNTTHDVGQVLSTWLVARTLSLLQGGARAVPGLFTAGLILVVTRFVARQVNRLFLAVEAGTLRLPAVHADTAAPTRRLAVALLWVFGVIAAYPYLPGSDSEAFKGVGVLVGLVLSLGSSGVANQAMSGLVLMYARSLRPGDFVRVGETEGTVSELGLLATKINTALGEEITIPNAVMVSNGTTNFSRNGTGVVIRTTVTIGYDTPWRQVHALLELAAHRTPGILQSSPPIILQRALSDFYPEYTLAVRCASSRERQEVLSALLASIQDCFNEFGVQILSPHFMANPPEPAIVPRARWHEAPATPETTPAPEKRSA